MGNKLFYTYVALLFVTVAVGIVDGVSVDKDLSMTLKEKQTLDQFRERVKPLLYQDYMKTDLYLIRWLRAKNFNLNDAETMLKENIRWRQQNGIDNLKLDDFKDMYRDYPVTLDTYDKEGRPIGVVDIYAWDIREAVLTGKGQRLIHYLDMLLNNITNQVFERQQRGMNVTQWKALASTDGFNMINHGCPICIPLWIQFLGSLENHFPGWLDEFIIIEAPFAVHTIVDILRPFLSRHTREGLRIFGPNKSQWMPYLDQRISRDQRRAAYGGTKPPAEWE